MDKKIYIQPQTEVTPVLVRSAMLIEGSVSGDGTGSDIGWGGVEDGEGDVKDESWTDIWE